MIIVPVEPLRPRGHSIVNFREMNKSKGNSFKIALTFIVVGAKGFEPSTSWSRTKHAKPLRYAPVFSEAKKFRLPMYLKYTTIRMHCQTI